MECLVMTYDQAVHESDGMPVGSVILTKPDGWQWSDAELREFFVVRVPDNALTAVGWTNLASPQVAERDDPNVIGEKVEVQLRERRYKFDLDVFDSATKAHLLNRIDEHEIVTSLGIENLIDLEAQSPRFEIGDLITSGGPL